MIHASLVTHCGDLGRAQEEKQKGLTVVQNPVSLEDLSPLTASYAREGGNENASGAGKDVSDLAARFHRKDPTVVPLLAARLDIWTRFRGKNNICDAASFHFSRLSEFDRFYILREILYVLVSSHFFLFFIFCSIKFQTRIFF